MSNPPVSPAQVDKRIGFSYGYVIVLAGFVLLMLIYGAQYSFGVFFKPVLAEFGWSRAVTSGAYSLNAALQGVCAIVAGRLIDRLSPRLVVTICGIFGGLGYLLMSQISAVWQMYVLYGAFISIGSAGIFVPLLSTVARWFTKRRGLATGIVVSGVGAGTIIMPPLANQFISSYSWRTSYRIIGLILLIAMIIFSQFLRRAPVDRSQPVDGDTPDTGIHDIQIRAFSFREAVRTRQFWMAGVIFLCVSFSVHTMMVHLVPYATDQGISASVAATLLSVVGWMSIMGKIGLGNAGDRFGNRQAVVIILVLMLAAFVWLQLASELWMLYLFAVLFAISYGGEIAVRSPLVAEYFGLKAHGAIFGVVTFVASLGGAIGPSVAGRIFDVSGSYYWAFILCAMLGAAGLILSLFLRPVAVSLPVKQASNS